jgi:hypothetical protein
MKRKEFINLVCESTTVVDGKEYQIKIEIPEGELYFEEEPEENRIKIIGYCNLVDFILKD